jgi:sarcosine oxidase
VLCTGAWLPGQVGAPLAAPRLRVLRQVLHWFATEQPGWYDPARCPVFIWLHGPRVEDAMYGFPLGDGQPGVKVATEQVVHETDPDAVDRGIAPAEVKAMFEQHLQGRLRGLLPRTVHGATCLYTMAADGRFVVDRHPRLDAVTIVSPCSGHGFKHSAGLGEAIAQRLLGETPFASLAPFALGCVDI